MKHALSISLLLAAAFAHAGPTLSAASYPSSAPQPTSAAITVNGAAGPVCTLPRAADGSVTPTCDLTTLGPGTYTIILTVSAPAGCPQPTSPATCISGGSASSAPFSLTLGAGVATAPAAMRMAP